MIRYIWPLLITISLLMVACNSVATPQAAVAPSEVEVPTPTPAAPEPEPTSTTAPTAAGEPTTPPKIVTFTLDPEQSTASYMVDEIFINEGNKLVTAIGRSNIITGTISLNYDDPAATEFGQFVVDISALTSDRSRRDRAIRTRWLESRDYPLATFDVTEIRNFPSNPQEGEEISFEMIGELMLKETAREAIWEVTAMLEGDQLTGSATTFIMLEDYNIPVPSLLGILSVTDGVTLTLDFTMTSDGN